MFNSLIPKIHTVSITLVRFDNFDMLSFQALELLLDLTDKSLFSLSTPMVKTGLMRL